MTETQAAEVVMLIKAATGGIVDQDQLDYFTVRLMQLDYEPALSSATLGSNTSWRRFPAWADFWEMYKSQARLREPVAEQRAALPPIDRSNPREVPFWVKRLIAARFLYARFGKDQDMRPFPEQKNEIDYTSGPVAEWMPEDAWVDEGNKVSDKEVWGILDGKSDDWTF